VIVAPAALLCALACVSQASAATPASAPLSRVLSGVGATATHEVAALARPAAGVPDASIAAPASVTAPVTGAIERASSATVNAVAKVTSTTGAGQVVSQLGATATSVGGVVRQVAATTAGPVGKVVSQLSATAAGAQQHLPPVSTGTLTGPSPAGRVPIDAGPRVDATGAHLPGAHVAAPVDLTGANRSDAGPPAARPSSSPIAPDVRGAVGVRSALAGRSAVPRRAGGRSVVAVGVSIAAAILQATVFGLHGRPYSLASGAHQRHASAPVQRPEPAPTPGGVELAAGAGSGVAFSLLLALVGVLALGAPAATRALRRADEVCREAPFSLIRARPG
jgi:hypothetical protein